MSETDVLSLYLREIGVNTPISLVFSTHNEDQEDENSLEQLSKPTSLSALKVQALLCEQCDLSAHRHAVMFGSGNEYADVLLVGDAPHDVGAEHTQEAVFTGDAQRLLEQVLATLGLEISQVYTTHIVQCATPEHRDPKSNEWFACQTWLQQKVALIQPKVILLMGRVAAQTLLQRDDALHDLRETWHEFENIPVRVVYHPAYLLRSPRQKKLMWHDLQLIQQRLALSSKVQTMKDE